MLKQNYFQPSSIDVGQAVNMNRLGMADWKNAQDRATAQAAGAALAGGDYKGGAAAAFEGGNIGMGLQIQRALQQRQDHELEAMKRQHASIGNLAMLADTPEKWAQAIQAAKSSGMQLPAGSENFDYRNVAISKAGMAGEAITAELRRRQEEKAGLMSVAPGATVYDVTTGKPVFTAAPRSSSGLALPTGVSAKMAEKAVETTDGADNILDALRALKDVSGTRQADGSYVMRPDIAAAVGPEPEFWGAYRAGKAFVGITGAAGAAERLAQAKQTIISQVTSLYNKGQGAISDAERAMYERLLGRLESAPDDKTFFGLIDQLDKITRAVRDRAAARRPIGLEDRAAERREKIAVPPVATGTGKSGKLQPATPEVIQHANATYRQMLQNGWGEKEAIEAIKKGLMKDGFDTANMEHP